MGNRCPTGHHVCVEPVAGIAGQFEQAGCPPDQPVQSLARGIASEARRVGRSLERQDCLQLPAKIERDFGGDLVGAVGDRRKEAQLARARREAVALLFEQVGPRRGDQRQNGPDPLAQRFDAAFRKHVGAMAGNADAEDERDQGRAPSFTVLHVFTEIPRVTV